MQRFHGLRKREIRTIMRDFNLMVDGNDGIDVILEFIKPPSSVYDPAFGVYDPTPGEQLRLRDVNARTIQKILVKGESPRYDELLQFGYLQAGDCLFFFKTSVDLEIAPDETLTIIDQYGVRWTPIPKTIKDFYAYITARFEDGGICQVIPCTLEQGKPSPTVPA